MITRIWKQIVGRKQIRAERRQQAILVKNRPTCPSIEDTYIVSFPKSGSTWFSFLLANVNLQLNDMPREVTWWNLREFIYDIHEGRDLPASPFAVPRGRFIHTHSEFNHAYRRVIYVVRDPRDTLISYYDMASKLDWFHGSMDECLASDTFGIEAWIRHVEGWVRKHTVASRIHFIRYEDLKVDPVAVLDRVYRLYGIAVEQEMLEKAVARSSFNAMRELEADYRKHSFDCETTFQFMRKGRTGSFREELTEAQTARIEERCAEWMKLFNYLPYSNGKERVTKTEQAQSLV